MGIDVLFCFMVDGWQRIFLTFLSALRDSGNCHIMFVAELFYNLFQLVCWNPAHLHTPAAGDSAGGKMQVQFLGGGSGVLAVHLKKVAHLIENHIIRVAFLDTVILPYRIIRLLGFYGIRFGKILFRLDFVIRRLFLFCQIAVLADQVRNSSGKFLPCESHIRAAVLFVPQTFSVVPFIAASCAGQSMRAPTNAILITKKTDSFFFVAVFLKKSVNAAFSAGHTASSCQGGVNLILGDELLDCGNFRQFRRKSFAGQRQVLQVFPNSSQPVVVEPQQIPVLLIGHPKGGIFF